MKKVKKIVTASLTLAMSAVLLSACGSDASLNAALTGSEDSRFFSQLSLDEAATAMSEGPKMKGQKGRKGFQKGQKGKRGGMIPFLKGVELTDTQQTEIKAIMEAAKANQPEKTERVRPDKEAMTAVQEKVKAAFVSETFDAATLKAELEALKPAQDEAAHEARRLAHAETTLKIWNVLTAEQKATAVANASTLAASKADRPERPSPVEHLSTALSLTDAQKASLETVFEANKPERPDPTAMLTVLNSGNATAADLVALHQRPEKGGRLNMLQTLHGVLTAEQRQAFAEKGLMAHGKRGHGGPGHAAKGGQMKGGMPGGY